MAFFSRTTQVSRYQKGKTNLDLTEARDSEWQWHQLGRMQVCTLLQTDNHARTPPLSFLQAGCPSCCPTNSVKALQVRALKVTSVKPVRWITETILGPVLFPSGFHLNVPPDVCTQVTGGSKLLGTHHAQVRPLTRVCYSLCRLVANGQGLVPPLD